MILRSIRIEGWRCFANPVELGPLADRLNVLFAPNATGKSTVFEALRRGLLDGHRVTGDEVKALQPWGRAVAPTVTIEFAHRGIEYRLRKRFLDRPSAELERKENGRFVRLADGDSADQQVRDLLTKNPPGRGLARPENWGLAQVLWAPQEQLLLSDLSGDLVADVQALLGAQVVHGSGAGASEIEKRIEDAYAQFFTPTGKMKGGQSAPPVVRLRAELQAATEDRHKALALQQQYEEAVRRVEDLRAGRAQARRDAESFSETLAKARIAAEAYRAMAAEVRERREQVKSAEAQHAALSHQMNDLRTTRAELHKARQALREILESAPLEEREAADRERETAEAKAALENARKDLQGTHKAKAIAEQAKTYVDDTKAFALLARQLEQIASAQAVLAERRKERSALIAPDAKALRAIRQAVQAQQAAQANLEAALITLEIVPEHPGTLTIVSGESTGPRSIEPSIPVQIQGAPEVVVDLAGVGRIRARGPAGSAAELRQARDKAAKRVRDLAAPYGNGDMESLELLAEKAAHLEAQAAEALAQFNAQLANRTVEDIERDKAQAGAALAHLLSERPDWRTAEPDPQALSATALADERRMAAAVKVAESTWQAAQERRMAAVERGVNIAARRRETERSIRMLQEREAALAADGKDDAQRDRELRSLVLEWEAARARQQESEQRLAQFSGDPTGEVTTLEKEVNAAAEAERKALGDEQREEGRLESIAAQGPYSALVQADEHVAALQTQVAAEDLRVSAIRLLYTTVMECRAAALAEVLGPVENAATRIMKRIAGPRLGNIRLSGAFAPERVAPDMADGDVRLELVSGGEREQIHLATRLALAEVLAKHERQLVVLDDVLVATDAGRLARIISILQEKADLLQILVLTCHPERYRGLEGACFVDLEERLKTED